MPRSSAVAAAFPVASGRRLRPPEDLKPGSPERAFFIETVNGLPPGHFAACDAPSLAVYVMAWTDLLVARAELQASGLVIDGKPNPLCAIVRDLTRTINLYARSLRLNPVSRNPQAPLKIPEQTMSAYDRIFAEQEARDGAS